MRRGGLSAAQASAVEQWFPGHAVVADHSWGLVERAVLQVRWQGGDVVVKAGGPDDHHMDREITAHEDFVAPLAAVGRAPRLLHADAGLRMLATTFLPGRLVEGDPAESEPETYRQAGTLLARLHAGGRRDDDGHAAAEDAKALAWLARPHRIPPATVARLRTELATLVPARPLVPTHGDWQPRNWLVDDGRVAVIDFGRAAWRPAESDLSRLAAQQWRGRPDLEQAFLDGYGDDPRTAQTWRRARLREAVGTAVWAHLVGDEAFEEQGHRMVAELLDG